MEQPYYLSSIQLSGFMQNIKPGLPHIGDAIAHGALPDGTEFVELFTHQHDTIQQGYFPLPVLFPGGKSGSRAGYDPARFIHSQFSSVIQ